MDNNKKSLITLIKSKKKYMQINYYIECIRMYT